jgi:hypothetical protein
MDVLDYQIFTLGAKTDPVPRTFKRSGSQSRETTRQKKRDSVVSLVADAPSRWRAMAFPFALLIAMSVYFVRSQMLVVQKIAPGGQYLKTMLVETGAVIELKIEDTGCDSQRPPAASAPVCSAPEGRGYGNRVTSHVLKSFSPRPGRSAVAQRDVRERGGVACVEELFGVAGKFAGTCYARISAHVYAIVQVSFGRRKPGRVASTSE